MEMDIDMKIEARKMREEQEKFSSTRTTPRKLYIEIWAHIKLHPDYMVSSFGRVKSFKQDWNGIILKNGTGRGGNAGSISYFYVNLDGQTHYVHRLVAQIFLKPEPGKNFIDHVNGDPSNNFIGNLRWCTQAENLAKGAERRKEQGIVLNKKPKVMLTTEDKSWILENYSPKHPAYGQAAMARRLGVNKMTIYNLIRKHKEEGAK